MSMWDPWTERWPPPPDKATVEDRELALHVSWCLDQAYSDEEFLRELDRVFRAKKNLAEQVNVYGRNVVGYSTLWAPHEHKTVY